MASSPWDNGAKLAHCVVQDWKQDPSVKLWPSAMLSPWK